MAINVQAIMISAGVAVLVVVGGVWAYNSVKKPKPVLSSNIPRIREDGLSVCQRAALERQRRQGSVGMIPLVYENSCSAMADVNPALVGAYYAPRRNY